MDIMMCVTYIILCSHLAFESRNKLAVLAEHGQVEVVVVVSDGDFSSCVNADTNRVVGDPCNVKH